MSECKGNLCHESARKGDHFWALLDGMLVVLIRNDKGYSVCGPWEMSVPEQEVTLIQRIDRPDGFEGVNLYYGM